MCKLAVLETSAQDLKTCKGSICSKKMGHRQIPLPTCLLFFVHCMWALHWLTSQVHMLCPRHAWKANNNSCFDLNWFISQRHQFSAGLKVSEMDKITVATNDAKCSFSLMNHGLEMLHPSCLSWQQSCLLLCSVCGQIVFKGDQRWTENHLCYAGFQTQS